jgi:predicted amidohydrolase YtcJ
VCSHVLVANTAALRAAGVRADTRVAGGEVDFDRGWLKESATELVRAFTTDTPAQTRKYLLKGMEICLALGLTSVQTNDEHTWSVYKQLSRENLLPLRVFLTIQQDEMCLPGRPRAREECGEMLQCHRVKIFADGALGAQTASLSQAYVVPHRCAKMHGRKVGAGDHAHSPSCEESSGPPATAAAASSASSAPPSPSPDSAAAAAAGNYGILIHTREALHEKVRSAHARGFRVEMHVIGDRAAEEGLDAFQAAGLTPADRPILTHCQVLREDLVRRMVRAGAIADVQPQFAVTDSKWASERLPEELLKSVTVQCSALLRGGSAHQTSIQF